MESHGHCGPTQAEPRGDLIDRLTVEQGCRHDLPIRGAQRLGGLADLAAKLPQGERPRIGLVLLLRERKLGVTGTEQHLEPRAPATLGVDLAYRDSANPGDERAIRFKALLRFDEREERLLDDVFGPRFIEAGASSGAHELGDKPLEDRG